MYTSLCAEDVVRADVCVDESAGIYPCYYYKQDGDLCLSTSVVSLIKQKGRLNLNREFRPERWRLRERCGQHGPALLDRLLGGFTGRNRPVCDWYNTHTTIDTEIFKVRPFETVTCNSNTVAAVPRGDFVSDSVFIEQTSWYMNKFINDIEHKFPDYSHVVLTGGKDSQMILLAHKVNNARWNVFSSEPNASIVKQWISDNSIVVNRIYEHDGRNEETPADLSSKIAAGDLFSNPRHLRWLPTLKRLGAALGGKCFFWAGTMGDALMAFHKSFHQRSLEAFYAKIFSRCITWQGNAHQVHKNFTGFPCLSPYHSREIWENVFFRYDYASLREGTDFRGRIGEMLAGRTISWPDANPSPPLYIYEKDVDLYRHYVRCIRTALSKKT